MRTQVTVLDDDAQFMIDIGDIAYDVNLPPNHVGVANDNEEIVFWVGPKEWMTFMDSSLRHASWFMKSTLQFCDLSCTPTPTPHLCRHPRHAI